MTYRGAKVFMVGQPKIRFRVREIPFAIHDDWPPQGRREILLFTTVELPTIPAAHAQAALVEFTRRRRDIASP